MRLHELAHARAGDKGLMYDISVIAYRQEHYAHLASHLTAERVRAHFPDVINGPVQRYELPQLGALKFVLHGAISGGVTRTLNLDIHGKSLSSSLLEIELPDLGD